MKYKDKALINAVREMYLRYFSIARIARTVSVSHWTVTKIINENDFEKLRNEDWNRRYEQYKRKEID